MLDAFTEETGIEVEVIQGGDAGTVVNQAILTNGNPQADVLFGIDSTFLSPGPRRGPLRALRGGGPRRGRRGAAPRPRAPRDADRLRRRVPQLRQGLLRGARRARARRASTTSPTPPTPTCSWSRTRPPRRRAWRSSWPASRPSARTAGRRGGATCAPTACRSSTAGRRPTTPSFSGGGASEGDRPLVVSYASSPPAEVVYADPPVDEPPTGVIDASCYRQVEGAGILAGTEHEAEARPAHRLPALRDGAGRRAAVDVRVPGARRRRAARRCSSSTPPRPTDVFELPAGGHRRQPGGVDRPVDRPRAPLSRRALGRRPARRAGRRSSPCFFVWPVANIVGEGLRGDERVGPLRGRRGARRPAAAPGGLVHALAGGRLDRAHPGCSRLPARPGARPLRVPRAPAASRRCVVVPFVLPTVVVGRGVPRPPRARRARSGSTSRGARRRSCSPTPSSTTPSWCAPSAGSGRASTRAPRRRPARSAPRGGGPSGDVTRPALRPAIASAAVDHLPLHLHLASASSASSAAPAASTLEVEIYRQTADLLDLPVASVLALLQLAAVGAMLVVQDRLERRRRRPRPSRCAPPRRAVRDRSRRAAVGRRQPRRSWRVFLGLPLATLVERSFRTGDGHGLAAWRALAGVDPGSRLFVSPLEAVGNSLRFAAVATVLAVVLGGLAAAALARSAGARSRGSSTRVLLAARSAPRPSRSASGSSSPSTSPSTCAPARGSSRSPRPWSRSRSSCAR